MTFGRRHFRIGIIALAAILAVVTAIAAMLPASWLKASLREIGLDPENLVMPEGRSTDHLPAGKTPWRDIWSGGQGVGLIADIPTVADLVRGLQREYLDACATPDMAAAARAALAKA
jgi:nitronate monooxygenase